VQQQQQRQQQECSANPKQHLLPRSLLAFASTFAFAAAAAAAAEQDCVDYNPTIEVLLLLLPFWHCGK
jgi:hypothetical protein